MNSMQDKLKDIILNVKEPYVIKSLNIPWPCFYTSFEDWCTQFDSSLSTEQIAEDGIVFETGTRKYTNQPQWEKLRGKIKMTAKEFYENSAKGNDFFENNWAAFSYKNIKELPCVCVKDFDFAYFGFPEVKDDITFWLSSCDAHTPCHFDTYGCNVVVQVYGIKSWMLFPPGSKLTPTRVPYEESSVYCTEPFFSPKDFHSYDEIDESCYYYDLQPGDVLIVPPKWWHYVENKSSALSVNAWIPIDLDTQSQIEECIVRIIMTNFIKENGSDGAPDILNPNELNLLDTQYDFFEILQFLVEQKSNNSIDSKHRHNYQTEQDLIALLCSFKEQITPVPKISRTKFREILIERSKRFDPTMLGDSPPTPRNYFKQQLINTICNPSTISNIATDFLQKINKQD